MRTFLPNNQIRKLASEDILNNILFIYLGQISFQFVHEGMEELIHVSLDARINWLSIKNESFAQRRSRIKRIL
jgi:hypothetical protein